MPDPHDIEALNGEEATGPVSITTQAYNKLRVEILSNALKPGEKLKVEPLCERLGLGPTPLREALSLLTSEGLVDRVDQRGFRVAAATLEDFLDVHSVRCWMEERALREAIRNADEAWEERVVLSLHRLNRTPRFTPEDATVANPVWERLHKQFHHELISACSSPILLKFCSQLYDLNVRYRQMAAPLAYPARTIGIEHQDIANAAVARAADQAVSLLIQHYRHTGDYLAERLSNTRF